ncbi:MAG: helix-turn-helix transcriptional regulator [Candidatus Omnitrophica bacterium]|nr:helix-turn-helix transcriptional regulator [Candidatus Omnitrophota bacterium]
MKIAKYFWDLKKGALKETCSILKNPLHPQFNQRMVTLLSRCDKPGEVFLFISKNNFIKAWPGVKLYWSKINRKSDFKDWWQTIYEQLLEKRGIKQRKPKGEPSLFFKKIGMLIRQARVERGLSQNELSLLTKVKQPEISKIEEGYGYS